MGYVNSQNLVPEFLKFALKYKDETLDENLEVRIEDEKIYLSFANVDRNVFEAKYTLSIEYLIDHINVLSIYEFTVSFLGIRMKFRSTNQLFLPDSVFFD